MGKITIEFDSSRRYEVVNAYNAIEGVLQGYGYVTEVVTVPGNTVTAPSVNAETPSDEQTAAPVEPAAPDVPVGGSGQPAAQAAPDAASPAETPAETPAQ